MWFLFVVFAARLKVNREEEKNTYDGRNANKFCEIYWWLGGACARALLLFASSYTLLGYSISKSISISTVNWESHALTWWNKVVRLKVLMEMCAEWVHRIQRDTSLSCAQWQWLSISRWLLHKWKTDIKMAIHYQSNSLRAMQSSMKTLKLMLIFISYLKLEQQ